MFRWKEKKEDMLISGFQQEVQALENLKTRVLVLKEISNQALQREAVIAKEYKSLKALAAEGMTIDAVAKKVVLKKERSDLLETANNALHECAELNEQIPKKELELNERRFISVSSDPTKKSPFYIQQFVVNLIVKKYRVNEATSIIDRLKGKFTLNVTALASNKDGVEGIEKFKNFIEPFASTKVFLKEASDRYTGSLVIEIALNFPYSQIFVISNALVDLPELKEEASVSLSLKQSQS